MKCIWLVCISDLIIKIVTPVDTLKESADLVVWLQDYANYGLAYLIDFVHGKGRKMPEILQVGVCFLYLSVVIILTIVFCHTQISC